MSECDVIVIGAGPAGMAAAVTAAQNGARTMLLDENASFGGQIYRAIATTPVQQRRILGGAYWIGETWASRLKRSKVQYRPQTTVWSLQAESDGVDIGILDGEGARILRARRVVVATGAMERPFPVPGWTLPGVMTAGAAQTLLKASGLVPEGRAVLAGSGPLLYLLARQLIAAGAPPALLLDTTPRANWKWALWHLPSFAASPFLAKGLALLWAVRRKVKIVRGVEDLRAEGEGRLRHVVWRDGSGEHRVEADLLLLHQGVVPTVNLWGAAGCHSLWDEAQACWHAKTDGWGQGSEPGIYIAGDGAGIGGAEIAALRGVLSGLQAATECGALNESSRDQQAGPARKAMARYLRGRDFLDALYRPADWARRPQGDTIVCRCEEVTAEQVLAASRQGCSGPNQMKAYLRCGMGPCQGRQCGLTVTELMAQENGISPAAVGHFRLRPPVKPLPLAALAQIPASDAERASVIRL